MKIKNIKLLSVILGIVVAASQAAHADTRTKKVQREARAGAVGGAVAATALAGPQMALAGANVGGAVVGTCSRVLRSGEVERAKKDLSRHKQNVKRALKKLKF